MNIKENLEQVKSEFRSDEKLLEGAFRIEKFYKRYKWVLLFVILVLVAFVGFQKFRYYQQEQKSERITQVYNEVLQSPDNLALQEKLKEVAPKLYDLYQFARASERNDMNMFKKLSQSSNEIVKTFAEYSYASLSKDKNLLANSSILKEIGALQEVSLLYEENSKDAIMKAHKSLMAMPLNSTLYAMISVLKHYGVLEDVRQNASKPTDLKKETTQGTH
ncbi:hypothetical protein [Helicobacter cetorum]|uniref:50S ribosomal protein L22 n=1 Tax=Helicobacter cetorum (strain ATCC BAA-540 / CCUG 52418 / MIT 99-5656) TaxID=1163745 RepID=I0ER19_HELCM|nr:hypothetical protein [Helicobacter cetorum]AFI05388.1 hypothetical protein HCD_01795 [Helicobacter cetorum MIT 99-5656]